MHTECVMKWDQKAVATYGNLSGSFLDGLCRVLHLLLYEVTHRLSLDILHLWQQQLRLRQNLPQSCLDASGFGRNFTIWTWTHRRSGHSPVPTVNSEWVEWVRFSKVPLDTLKVISERRQSSRQSLALVRTTKINSKISKTSTKPKILKHTTYIQMHTNIILTNKTCIHAQSNYTNIQN